MGGICLVDSVTYFLSPSYDTARYARAIARA
nr:MAG TPA: hypothetical protein [Caudoviricetes sp.]